MSTLPNIYPAIWAARKGLSFSTAPTIQARQHIRRLRGGSQSQLLYAADGNYYVTKFVSNPQHTRVLANEMLASRLGRLLGLPVPEVRIIEVSDWLIKHTPELCMELGGVSHPCPAGLQLGIQYVANPATSFIADYLPESMLANVQNCADFARCLVLDKWTCNTDGRQAVFYKPERARKYRAVMIDQGYCFNAGEWNFQDSPLRGVYARNCVYQHVTGWASFEPALSIAESIGLDDLWACASDIPHEWFSDDLEGLYSLLETLHKRRDSIRARITDFRNSSRDPFTNWKGGSQ